MTNQPVTTYPAIIGRVIANKRKDLRMDQAEAADKAAINRSTWSRIENGDSAPDAVQLSKIADTLDMKPADILTKAEVAKKDLLKRGFKIEMSPAKSKKSSAGGLLALVGAAALGALIAAAAKDNQDEK